jgi:putative hydrolase of the HAD superfamily
VPDLLNSDAIIFDLGGVILNIDHQAPILAFEQLGIPDFGHYYSKVTQSSLFVDLETGLISPETFRNRLRGLLPVLLTDEAIDHAWNSIIGDFPEENIRLLEALKPKYRTFLLSNTNILHFETINNRLKASHGYGQTGELMEKAYYSHQLGLRKPDSRIFEHVIKDAGLQPERTLFIDDTEEHVLAAQRVGLKVHHLKDDETIQKLFSKPA